MPGPKSPESEVANLAASATVLVLEDEAILRQAVAKALRKNGFEVLEAADGSAAIEVVSANGSRIDVALLDMTFPGASLNNVIAEYLAARSGAKIILTSAHSEEMASAAAGVPQIRGFIRKPFLPAELVKKLRDTLSS